MAEKVPRLSRAFYIVFLLTNNPLNYWTKACVEYWKLYEEESQEENDPAAVLASNSENIVGVHPDPEWFFSRVACHQKWRRQQTKSDQNQYSKIHWGFLLH
jgi:hypothetical protein